ncbi:hypothetical protein LINPERHAP2_LOCUS16601 [Linum perenne]
MGCRGGS